MFLKESRFSVRYLRLIVISISLHLQVSISIPSEEIIATYRYNRNAYDTKPTGGQFNPNIVNCSCFHQISTIEDAGLTLIKVTHPLDQPMIAAIIINENNHTQEALWYTFNMENNRYEESVLEKFVIENGIFRDFVEIIRGDKYFGAISFTSANGKAVKSHSEVKPAKNDFFLTKGKDKLSHGSIVLLDKVSGKFSITQILFGDDFGRVLTISLITKSGAPRSVRDCFLFSILDVNDFRASIFCFHPLNFEGEDDHAVHPFQNIRLHVSPLLSTLQVGEKTIVLITDSDKRQTSNLSSNYHGNVVIVWAHPPGNGLLVLEDKIKFSARILTLDSIETADHIYLLAVGTSGGASVSGSLSILQYDVGASKFVKIQVIKENGLIQARFQRIVETNETILITLTSAVENNIRFYSLGHLFQWTHVCDATAPGAFEIEPSSFFYRGKYRAHVIAMAPPGAAVIQT